MRESFGGGSQPNGSTRDWPGRRDSFFSSGRTCRWWLVTGRNRHAFYEVGRFLAVSGAAAIRRAKREKAALVGGLQLAAEVSR